MNLLFLSLFVVGLRLPLLQDIDFRNFAAVLQWLTTIGSAVVTGFVFSWVAENVQAWHNLPRQAKFVIPPIFAVLVSIGATLLLQQTEFIQMVSPWFATIMTALLIYFGTQKGYMEAKAKGYGVKEKPLGRD